MKSAQDCFAVRCIWLCVATLLCVTLASAATRNLSTSAGGLPEQKPGAPVEITLTPKSSPVAGQPFELEAHINPLVDADSMEVYFAPATSFTPLSNTVVSFTEPKAGQQQTATITLMSSTGGELRVGCTVILSVDGQRQPRATVITLNIKGVITAPASKPAGIIKQRANGEKVIVLQ